MIKYRPYQRQAIDAFYHYHKHGAGCNGLMVLPTAAGKSIIIAGLTTEICQTWPDQRIIILSHVRELIAQNHDKLAKMWPAAPAGIYSASLNKKQAHFPIVFATIQSVYQKAKILGHRDLVFIDEAHLLNAEGTGMYMQLLAELREINPKLKVTGYTATDYRMDSGMLTEGDNRIFDDIIIDIPLIHLLEEGYLTPPIGKAPVIQADLTGVRTTAGEYNIKDMAARFDSAEFISAALDNDLEYLHERNAIAIFCATVENAQHVCHAMLGRGFSCAVLYGGTPSTERDDILERFRSGSLHCVVSVGVLTTGTDIPNIDCILLMRATQSAVLFQQIVGRGFRVMYANGYDLETKEGRVSAIKNGCKPNFLVLDHGGNIERHGPITHVIKPGRRNKGERRAERLNGRICEICRSGWPLDVMVCGLCGHEMVKPRDATANLNVNASEADILGTPFTRGEVAKWFDVDDVNYSLHSKKGEPNKITLKVMYRCGISEFIEYISINYIGDWWRRRSTAPIPEFIQQAYAKADTLQNPIRIMVKKEGKFYKVLYYDFHPTPKERTA